MIGTPDQMRQTTDNYQRMGKIYDAIEGKLEDFIRRQPAVEEAS